MAQWADSTRAALRDYKGGISTRLLHAASQSRKIMDPATEIYKGVPSFNDEESKVIANGTSMMRGHAVDLANMVGGKAHALKAYGGGPIAKNMLRSHYNKDMTVLDSMADKVTPSYRDSVRDDAQDITDAYLAALRHF
ncbi:hypothetical protein BDW42DRAFT_158785 [Aspergillus taichungensis]|uniref:Uncharacterized protein n=1 Tax=Aspergillus taichungensis TaxID=482145 RepID=A0A2J5I971_9EURO|nr:hypothetical protein BDW42DRAFT_158785 [Aspergillus taichungensis]